MSKRIIGMMIATALALAVIPAAVFAKTINTTIKDESGIVWDMETDPMMHQLSDYGLLPLDNDGDGNGWEWSDSGELSHYEGSGYVYSLSSLDGNALAPDNMLLIPAFTGSSFSFYANEIAEGEHHDVLAVWRTTNGEEWDEVFCEALNGTEPTLYTIETDSTAPYCLLAFRHYRSEGGSGVVVDYVTIPDGEPYVAPDDPFIPEVPEGMIPIDGASVFGMSEPELGGIADAGVHTPDDVPYHISAAYWMEYDIAELCSVGLEQTDTFRGGEGYEYYLCVELEPDEGYWFDLHGAVSINGDESLVGDYSINLENGILYVESIHYTIEQGELEPIHEISITGFELPTVGSVFEESARERVTTPEGADYEIILVEWYDADYEPQQLGQPFEEGATMVVKLRPLQGYAFAEDAALLINGETAMLDEESSFVSHSQLAYIVSTALAASADATEAPADPTGTPAGSTEAPAAPTQAPADRTPAPAGPSSAPATVPTTGTVSLAAFGVAAAAVGACSIFFRRKEDR